MPVHIVCVNVTETISPVNQKYLLPEPFKKKKSLPASGLEQHLHLVVI